MLRCLELQRSPCLKFWKWCLKGQNVKWVRLRSSFLENRKMTKPRRLKAKKGSQSDRTETRDFRVAIAQFAPVYLDKAASVVRAIQIIQDAKKRGARLVAFGETWLPGYPAWLDVCPGAALWENGFAKDVFARLRSNSIVVPGEEVNALREAARDLKIAIVIGVNERVDSGPGNG